jgi:peptidoglycan/LPS O-acetylase OafA/YrhL
MTSATALPPSTDRAESLPALTSLRFFAALAVVVLHYRDLLGPLPAWLLHCIVGGQYGVTFFFVLSGFILTYKYRSWFEQGVHDAAYWRFQRFRLARLYPIYVLGLLLDTPWHLIERVQAGQLAHDGMLYWASWLLNLVGLQAWVPAVPYAMFWNTPAWSVAAEFFFYATFPFVTAVLARRLRSPGALAACFVAAIVLGTALSALVIHALVYRWQASAQTQYIVIVYNPLLRYNEFLAGCLAGHYFLQTRGRSRYVGSWLFEGRRGRNAACIVCVAAVALRVGSADYTGPSAWWWLADVSAKYSVFILPFGVFILAVARGPTWLTPLLENRGLVLLGEASYALYIIHWSATTFLRMNFLGDAGTPFVHGLFLIGTVALSVACYRWIEVPWRRRLRGAPSAAAAVAAA